MRSFALTLCLPIIAFGLLPGGVCGAADLSRTAVFHIVPQPLDAALLQFSAQSGFLITAPAEQLVGMHTAGVNGSVSIERALRALLAESGLSYRQTGDDTLVVSIPPAPPAHATPAAVPHESRLDELKVTARRVEERAVQVPQSMSVLAATELQALGVHDFEDYALRIPNMSSSYGTGQLGYGDSRTIAIRGISGSGTTAVYIDDVPIPEGIDPHIVDLQRIEVLKGPQGTLYGQGSLGGSLKLVTHDPALDDDSIRVQSEVGRASGGVGADHDVTVIANASLAGERLGLRLAGYDVRTAGFITREYPADGSWAAVNDQGASHTYGGTVSLLFQPTDGLQATLRATGQHTAYDGLPTVYAPLPAFEPTSDILQRQADIQEFVDDNWSLESLELVYRGEHVDLTSTTSLFQRHESELEDGTEATTELLRYYGAPASLGAQGFAWPVYSRTGEFTQEIRAAIHGNRWIHGVAGAFISRNWSTFGYPPFLIHGLAASGVWDNDLGWSSYYPLSTWDKAFYGELYAELAHWELTVGARHYWLRETAATVQDGFFNGGPTQSANLVSGNRGTNPKAVASYRFDTDTLAYLSVSRGFRAGRPNPDLPAVCDPGLAELGVSRASLRNLMPDTVWNFEAGAKRALGPVTVSGAVFQMNWNDIQQRVTIPVCGNTLLANAGAARNRGAEFELTASALHGIDARLSLGYDRAVITRAGLSGQSVGSPVYEAPRFNASGSLAYRQTLASDIDLSLGTDASYIAASRSAVTVSGANALLLHGYSMIGLHADLIHGSATFEMFVKNLANTRANLGDINPVSYVRTTSNGELDPRVALSHPREVGIRMNIDF